LALARSSCHVVDRRGAREEPLERETVEGLLAGSFFWLDLRSPTADDLALLEETLALHPLAVEDSLHWGQRPKLEEYEGFDFLVLFGFAPDEDGLAEVHCYYSERFLVTLHRDEAPGLDALYHKYAQAPHDSEGIHLLYRVVDSLVDSFFPALTRIDERFDLIEDDLLRRPREDLLQDIFTMKRRLASLRQVIAPQRDLVGRLAAAMVELPGLTPEVERYFRDVYDHLIRLNEMIDVSRELMTSAIDVYMSATSNRMNAVMKQLTVIATIFLPLTFITGFFGQNFAWLVRAVDGWVQFVVLGVGLELLAVAALVAYFRRHGWF
jgi:magnesium transporter